MVKCCSAIGCASRCLPNSKLKGLTFHVFPTDENIKRKWVLAMKRLDVNTASIWEPKKGDVLCSRHFMKTDFDRSAPNVKLKPGVIPSIFDSPSHLQEKTEELHCRKNFTLETLPVTNHNHQYVRASSCIEEFQSQFIFIRINPVSVSSSCLEAKVLSPILVLSYSFSKLFYNTLLRYVSVIFPIFE
ncbi:THAP domain-containing protein 6 isoform X2 [Manis pentadactyla]|uniref:THAP domain-containing protein 6 isoform X2 n=1 Tax=Manis pentadactyla TaxID=143292 RepID=UPI00255C7F7C|nr:THAP domain-containing protein 6 isoform X2 [Manis pentadactyla]